MSVLYNSLHVDERYVSNFEPNLFFDNWLIPGVTCTDKYQEGPAGGYYVHKLRKGAAIEPGTPGRDFTHNDAQDDLVQIVLNNNYMESTKIYRVQMNAIDAPVAEQKLADTTLKIKEGICGSAIAALVHEGTKGSVIVPTKDTAKDTVISVRTALVKARASSAKVILCHPDFYGMILSAAGKEFTPAINERIVGNGEVGNWLGFTFFNVGQLGSGETFKYRDYAGTLQTVTAAQFNKVNFIAYNPNVFSVLHNLEIYRLIDGGKDFNGVLAQAEVNSGFRVTNNDLCHVSLNAAYSE